MDRNSKDGPMIPYQLDPTLHPAQPVPQQLDDGCLPPGAAAASPQSEAAPGEPAPVDPTLWAKSEF